MLQATVQLEMLLLGKKRKFGEVLDAEELSKIPLGVRDALVSQKYIILSEEGEGPKLPVSVEDEIKALRTDVVALKAMIEAIAQASNVTLPKMPMAVTAAEAQPRVKRKYTRRKTANAA